MAQQLHSITNMDTDICHTNPEVHIGIAPSMQLHVCVMKIAYI